MCFNVIQNFSIHYIPPDFDTIWKIFLFFQILGIKRSRLILIWILHNIDICIFRLDIYIYIFKKIFHEVFRTLCNVPQKQEPEDQNKNRRMEKREKWQYLSHHSLFIESETTETNEAQRGATITAVTRADEKGGRGLGYTSVNACFISSLFVVKVISTKRKLVLMMPIFICMWLWFKDVFFSLTISS